MSSALAIASVTYVIKDILRERLSELNTLLAGPDMAPAAAISALPPNKIDTEDSETDQLNIFMYLTTPNLGWRNRGFPSHNARGERISNPPLALDLHYILSAYGDEELNSDILLGYGMQILHENPVLKRDYIRESLMEQPIGTLPTRLAQLAHSGLAEQLEQIKISPEALNTEEISRLWTAFGTKYRPSAFYKVSVVLIESQQSTKTALPVRQSNIYVRPFRQPTITKISSRSALNAPILDGQKILHNYQLVLTGIQLKGEINSVNIGEMEILEQDFISFTDTQLIVQLPVGLPAGIHGVQVIHQIPMGSPPLPHKGFSSNVEAFVLSPTIVEPIIQGIETLTIEINPPVEPNQKVLIFLNGITITSPPSVPQAYSFERLTPPLASPPEATNTAIFQIGTIEAGTYLVRVRVDQAESFITANYQSPSIIIV